MRKRNKEIQLTSYEDLLGMDTVADQEAGQLLYIPLTDLYEFKDHPFKVLDDEKMQETVESIKNYGVLTPGIVRPRQDGGYEIIAGHRRNEAVNWLGLQKCRYSSEIIMMTKQPLLWWIPIFSEKIFY